jgi:hypothetical protein
MATKSRSAPRASACAKDAIHIWSLQDDIDYGKTQLVHWDLDAHTTRYLMKTATAWHWTASMVAGTSSVVVIAVVGSGCSGINASKSISPLDFILPGLMQHVPVTLAIPNTTNTPTELAQAGHDLPSMQIHPNYSL